jgi:uncharacterized membrane protein YedE/YeeE
MIDVIVPPLIGGVLIGLAAALLLFSIGRIAGISGIVAGVILPEAGEWPWRLVFVIGLLAGGLLVRLWLPEVLVYDLSRSLPILIGAGLLVGVGTRVGGGCTSGHGVCGLGRLSRRSLVAVLTFMAVAALTVAITGGLS